MKIYSIPEFAKLCDLTEKTIRKHIASNTLKSLKIGKRAFLSHEDNKTYIDYHTKVKPS